MVLLLRAIWYQTVTKGVVTMNIKTELLKDYISHIIRENIVDFEIDASKIADSRAI